MRKQCRPDPSLHGPLHHADPGGAGAGRLRDRFAVRAAVVRAASWLYVTAFLTIVGIHRPDPDAAIRSCATIRSPPICASSSRRSGPRCGSTSSRATRTARRSAATSAPWSINAPRACSTSGPSAPNYDVYAAGYEWMAHSIAPTPVEQRPFPRHRSAARIAPSPTRPRSSTSRP